jgi:mRNA interferase RelE/StbE
VAEIVYRRQPRRYLGNLPQKIAEWIVGSIEALADDDPADVQPLAGQPGYYRLRIGQYRVIFRRESDPDTIVITWIGPRGDAY